MTQTRSLWLWVHLFCEEKHAGIRKMGLSLFVVGGLGVR